MSTRKVCTQCGSEFGPEQRFCPNDGSPLRPVGGDDALVGQVIADRYQILELLGEGGMGRVYLAEHVRMGRRSAVKVMSPNLALAADAISRFNREAANASRINHPNVAQIYDFGETADGVLYLAMEYIEGDTLTTIIERDGALPLHRAAQITKQVADALGAAHHMGIVHRDLKPDNVMVARHIDGSDWVKVVDFGIAKTVQRSGEGSSSQTVTTAGVSLGTPEYMSPEQLAGERLDHRSDIYAMGLVCFNLLTADLPYPRVTSKETLVRRLTSKPRTLGEVRSDRSWPLPLQAALDRALAPEPADRYETAVEFGRDVVAAATAIGDQNTVRLTPVATAAPSSAARVAAQSAGAGQTRKIGEPPAATDRGQARRRVVPLAFGGAAIAAVTAAVVFSLARDWSGRPPATPPAESTVVTRAAEPPPGIPAPTSAPAPAPPTPPAAAPQVTVQSAARGDSRASTATSPAPQKHLAPAESAIAPAPASPALTSRTPSAGRGFRHQFLRANGDSGTLAELPPNATDDQRIAILRQDIQAHVGRMNNFLLNGDIPRARGEAREVAPVLRMLHQLYPDAPQTRQVEGFLRIATAKAMAACRTILADSTKKTPPNFRCEQMFPEGRGRGRATNRPPSIPN